jgi:hypothetical protein
MLRVVARQARRLYLNPTPHPGPLLVWPAFASFGATSEERENFFWNDERASAHSIAPNTSSSGTVAKLVAESLIA